MAREMKDSGIEWIGQIPLNWDIIKNKHIFYEVCDLCTQEGFLPLLSVSEYYGVALKSEKIKEGDFETRAESVIGYKICKPNDLVFNIMLSWKRALGVSIYDGIVSPAYCIYRRKNDSVFPKYYHYLFRTNQCADEFKRFSTGIIDSRLRLYPEVFFSLNTVLPSYEEQERIASFLDTKCAEIDKAIESTKSSIEEYKKLKQAIITEAVTKGLDPNVEMKDSGIEWIGEIPRQWNIAKVKFLVSDIKSGEANNNLILEDGLFPVYGGGSQIGYSDNWNTENNILIGRVGAKCGCVTRISGKAWATDNALIVVSDNSDWLYYAFIALDLHNLNTSNAQPLITASKVMNCFLPFPSLEEQLKIISFLDSKCSEIDSIIKSKEKLIEELTAYRKSLIYEYVTGKKEVPAV